MKNTQPQVTAKIGRLAPELLIQVLPLLLPNSEGLPYPLAKATCLDD